MKQEAMNRQEIFDMLRKSLPVNTSVLDRALDEIAFLQEQLAAKDALLKQLEWSKSYSYCTGWPSCPICGGIKPGEGRDENGTLPDNQGHRKGCELANAIDTTQDLAPCPHCYGTGEMVRDEDIGTTQPCFVCDGTGKVPKELK